MSDYVDSSLGIDEDQLVRDAVQAAVRAGAVQLEQEEREQNEHQQQDDDDDRDAEGELDDSATLVQPCQSVYFHPEYPQLLNKYQSAVASFVEVSKQLLELKQRLSKYEQVNLPPVPTPAPAPHPLQHAMDRSNSENVDPNTPQSYLAKPSALHEERLAKYRVEIQGWTRPVLSPEQILRIPNYFASKAVNTDMQHAFLDLNGNSPKGETWNHWLQDRRVICKDILDPSRTWKDQDEHMITFACDVIEKRHPELAYCDDARWKAKNFLRRRVEQMGKVSGSGAGKKFRAAQQPPGQGRQDDHDLKGSSNADIESKSTASKAAGKKRAESTVSNGSGVEAGENGDDDEQQIQVLAGHEAGTDAETGSTNPPKPKRPRKARQPRQPKQQQQQPDAHQQQQQVPIDPDIDARTEAIIRGTTDLLVSGGYDLSAASSVAGSNLAAAAGPSGTTGSSQFATSGSGAMDSTAAASSVGLNAATAAAIAAAVSNVQQQQQQQTTATTSQAQAQAAASALTNAFALDPVSGGIIDPHYLAHLLRGEGILSSRPAEDETGEEGAEVGEEQEQRELGAGDGEDGRGVDESEDGRIMEGVEDEQRQDDVDMQQAVVDATGEGIEQGMEGQV